MTRVARSALVLALAATVVGLGKVHAAWVAPQSYDLTASSRFGWTLAFLGLLYVTAYGVGLPDLPRTRRAALVASLQAAVVSALGISAVQLVTGDALLPRFVVFATALAVVPIGTATNALARRGSGRAEGRDRIVLVGSDGDLSPLADELQCPSARPAAVVAHLREREAGAGGGRPLVDMVDRARATVVVLSRVAQADDHVVAQAASLHERGVRIRTLSLFYEEWLGKLPLSELERTSLFFDIGQLHRARYGRAKRVLDVVLGAVGVLVLLPVLPVVLLGNLLGNPGPLLYRQERVGRFGDRFSILKLRTMRPTADGVLPDEWAAVDDPRITPFGQILRRTHLDELPQVVNILRGDLSVVGPRPEQPHYVEELSEKLPFYDLRHLVRPGLTGWAQVTYGYAGDESDALEKLQYEFFYLRHQDLRFDLRIVGRTVRSILGSQGGGR